MAKEHMKRCSASLTGRKMLIKTTVRYHYTPVGVTRIKNSDTSNVGEGVKERSRTHCWRERKMVQPLSKRVWQFLVKQIIWLPCKQAVALLCICPTETEAQVHTKPCPWMFLAALCITAQLEQPRFPSIGEGFNGGTSVLWSTTQW